MSLLYTDPVAIVRADTAGDVTGAVERIESAVANGLHAAGFASYELGYALEPRLAALMPQAGSVPASQMLPAIGIYSLLAIGLVTLGIGSILARPIPQRRQGETDGENDSTRIPPGIALGG